MKGHHAMAMFLQNFVRYAVQDIYCHTAWKSIIAELHSEIGISRFEQLKEGAPAKQLFSFGSILPQSSGTNL